MRKVLYWVLVGIFAIIFVISTCVVVDYVRDAKNRREDMDNLFGDFTDPPTNTTLLPTTPTRPGTTVSTRPGVTTMPTVPTFPTVPTEPPVTTLPGTVPTEPTGPVNTTPIHGHNYLLTVVNPTCTEAGYLLYECECGESYREAEVPPVGHTYGSWKYGTYANKDTKRTRTRECLICKAPEEC